MTEENLLPRRREVLEITRDHGPCSFDFIARRFPAINRNTLYYDLAQLVKAGLVRRLGVTRGCLYVAVG